MPKRELSHPIDGGNIVIFVTRMQHVRGGVERRDFCPGWPAFSPRSPGVLWISGGEVAAASRSSAAHMTRRTHVNMVSGAVVWVELLVMVVILRMNRFHGVLVMYGSLGMYASPGMPKPLGMTVSVGSPVRMILGPFGMVGVHPTGIVLMPPVSLMPIVIGAVCAPAAVIWELSPDVGMVLHELLQIRVLMPEFPVVNQVGIPLQLLPQSGMLAEKIVQARFVVLGRRDRRHRHCEQHDQNGWHDFEMLHM